MRRRVLVLLNPHAGRRESLARARAYLNEHAPAQQVEQRCRFIIPDPSDREAQHTESRRALAEGIDAVLVYGGDGMVGLAANLLTEHAGGNEHAANIPLGIVPAGTGNDFARALGAEIRDPGRALQQVVTTLIASEVPVRQVDALDLQVKFPDGRHLSRRVVNSVNMGFDAVVNQRANRMHTVPGPLRYLVALAGTIGRFRPFTLNMGVDDAAVFPRKLTLVCVQNGPTIGGGIPLAPHAQLDDGAMDLSCVGPLSRLSLVALFPLVYMGGHRKVRELSQSHAHRITLELPAEVPIYADGDEIHSGSASLSPSSTQKLQVSIAVVPHGLTILDCE